jgi:multidrug resistance efflux pump
MHIRPRKIILIPVLAIVLVASGALWYLNQQQAQAQAGSLTASGTIEAVEVQVSPEMGGQVEEVLVSEGESLEAGQVLVRFADHLLQAQLEQAEAAQAAAEANYALVASGVPDEQQTLATAAARLEVLSARQAIDELYQKSALMKAQAAKNVADSRNALRSAETISDSLHSPADPNDIEIARSLVTLSDEALERAEKRLKPMLKKAESNPRRAAAQLLVSLLEKQYDMAVKRLNYLEGTADEIYLAQAEAGVALARENLEEARRAYAELDSGPDPDVLELAQARLAAAEAKLAAAQAPPTPEQLAVAKAQVDTARAAVNVIRAQMEKLVLLAPANGVVLSRSVENGEVAAPGAPLLTLGYLDDLKITVYVPEDRYGAIMLGDQVQVQVDSFPGEQFSATVVRIADQAEFTPRNVQTEEGRRTTVFAVELQVNNPDGRLKPGMPADVSFENL